MSGTGFLVAKLFFVCTVGLRSIWGICDRFMSKVVRVLRCY